LFKSKGFTEQGKASWYGEKFHGHLTANGEIYDMYQMSAAHKTLPIPSFAKVTNQANGKQVIVRVNDRGPFHGGRIIDLSYAAALKLDMLKTGVADVKLEVVKVTADGEIISANRTKLNISNGKTSKRLFIQVAAFQDKPKIQNLGLVLQTLYQLPHQITTQQDIHKLQIGPLGNEQEAGQLLQELKRNGYPGAYKILLD
jgi:rare lipoprotein A